MEAAVEAVVEAAVEVAVDKGTLPCSRSRVDCG